MKVFLASSLTKPFSSAAVSPISFSRASYL